jgi:hypothetical protein
MTKKVLTLTIKDLKDLGIIGNKTQVQKRKSKSKSKKRSKFAISSSSKSKSIEFGKPSPSDHMVGTVHYYNTSNLNNELMHEQNRNLRLTNDSKQLGIDNENKVHDKLQQLERQQNYQQNNYHYHLLGGDPTINDNNSDGFNTSPLNKFNISRIPSKPIGFSLDDNNDVPASSSSEDMTNEGTLDQDQDVNDKNWGILGSNSIDEDVNDKSNDSNHSLSSDEEKSISEIDDDDEEKSLSVNASETTPVQMNKHEAKRIELRNELKRLGVVNDKILTSNNQKEMSSRIKKIKEELNHLKETYRINGGTKQDVFDSNDLIYIRNQLIKLRG